MIMPPESVRLSVNINLDTSAALRELADRKGVSVTEIVRRAVSVYKFVDDEIAKGQTVQLLAANGNITSVAMVG